MTKQEAHNILDAARRGSDVSRIDIDKALRVTGDISGCYRTPVEFRGMYGQLCDEHDSWPVVQKHLPVGAWEVSTAKYRRAASPFDGLTA